MAFRGNFATYKVTAAANVHFGASSTRVTSRLWLMVFDIPINYPYKPWLNPYRPMMNHPMSIIPFGRFTSSHLPRYPPFNR